MFVEIMKNSHQHQQISIDLTSGRLLACILVCCRATFMLSGYRQGDCRPLLARYYYLGICFEQSSIYSTVYLPVLEYQAML